MMNQINEWSSVPVIVTTANDKYALPVATMLKSLDLTLRNGEKSIVYILYFELNENFKKEIEFTIKWDKITINWVQIDPDTTKGLKTSYWWPLDVYYRLLIEELLPQYDKVIYLDADIIINRSIYDLWQMEIADWPLMAIQHLTKKAGLVSGDYGLPVYKLLGIPETTLTFNSGVLVMNLRLWRREKISSSVFKYLRDYDEHVLWLDQDGLNAILYNKWLPLPYEWNVQVEDFSAALTGFDSFASQRECMKILKSPSIIHYAGSQKPWFPNYKGLFREEFLQYIKYMPSSFLDACSSLTEQAGASK